MMRLENAMPAVNVINSAAQNAVASSYSVLAMA